VHPTASGTPCSSGVYRGSPTGTIRQHHVPCAASRTTTPIPAPPHSASSAGHVIALSAHVGRGPPHRGGRCSCVCESQGRPRPPSDDPSSREVVEGREASLGPSRTARHPETCWRVSPWGRSAAGTCNLCALSQSCTPHGRTPNPLIAANGENTIHRREHKSGRARKPAQVSW
jgi:hypothetical protein